MTAGRIALLALLVSFAGSVGLAGGTGAGAQETATAAPAEALLGGLPSTDLLRIEQDGSAVAYDLPNVAPVVVATPDGGAWAFFSAFPRVGSTATALRVYAARFDPRLGVWLPGAALPGKMFQFGPTAVVDAAGTVHVVYADGDSESAASMLLHVRDDGAGGWSAPVQVAPDPNAGYQVMPSLSLDAAGGLHLLWREQRSVSPQLRAKDENNGDVFASDLVGGAWSAPVQVTRRPSPDADINAGFPQLAASGDRLLAVWSVYRGTTEEEMKKAVRVEWSSRSLAAPDAWTPPATLLDRTGGETGGPLVALAADPRGGAVLAYGRIREDADPLAAQLSLRRFDPTTGVWGADVALANGDLGYYVAVAVWANGTAYLTYDTGRNRNAEVGSVVVPADGTLPGMPTVLTAGQDGAHGQSAVAVGTDGRPWVAYVHAAAGADQFTEVRALRGPWPVS